MVTGNTSGDVGHIFLYAHVSPTWDSCSTECLSGSNGLCSVHNWTECQTSQLLSMDIVWRFKIILTWSGNLKLTGGDGFCWHIGSCYSCIHISFFDSLHEEVLAQRALDRRLTEELMRFKSTIGVLTRWGVDVKGCERAWNVNVLSLCTVKVAEGKTWGQRSSENVAI